MKKKTKRTRKKNSTPQYVTALAADAQGEIFELEGFAAVGMANSEFIPLTKRNTLAMPYGGELMLLPKRRPVVFDLETGQMTTLVDNPYAPGEPVYPVAAFNSPGYVNALISAYEEYEEGTSNDYLPLFSYGAAGWQGDGFRTAVILVDKEPRQDLRQMQREKVLEGVLKMQRVMPKNRLRKHLEKCALEYGCPAGKNFFLSRYEAPLPTSRACNAHCLGCLSLQQESSIPCSQDRIDFTPSPEEIAEVALAHIRRVKKAVVSFGQGCEGDPLLAAKTIEPAIRLIREATSDGTINMNTNGSLPDILEQLFDAGLDSIRISMNSVQEACYNTYFRPAGYCFADVLKGIDIGISKGKHVAINYLNCPGFTDSHEEVEAFFRFREAHPVHFIQWRNLNFDPVKYWQIMGKASPFTQPMGMNTALKSIHKRFPDLKYGYFNPPKEKWNL
jgi:pyruvate-formate lyase-activating enzyme